MLHDIIVESTWTSVFRNDKALATVPKLCLLRVGGLSLMHLCGVVHIQLACAGEAQIAKAVVSLATSKCGSVLYSEYHILDRHTSGSANVLK